MTVYELEAFITKKGHSYPHEPYITKNMSLVFLSQNMCQATKGEGIQFEDLHYEHQLLFITVCY